MAVAEQIFHADSTVAAAGVAALLGDELERRKPRGRADYGHRGAFRPNIRLG